MKKFVLISFLAFSFFLDEVNAQNRSIRDVLSDELGVAVFAFVVVILIMVGCTWFFFCICMCNIAINGREQEKIDLSREERERRRTMPSELKVRQWRDGQQFVQQQYDIESSIMGRQYEQGYPFPPITEEEEALDSASVLRYNAPPHYQQQRILNSLKSIPIIQGQQLPVVDTSDYSSDSDSSINPDDIVDIMDIPSLPRPVISYR